MLPAVPHSIPELGAPQFGHTLQQKHFFLLASPCLILAKLLYSFHFLSLENSLVLLMQCSNVALLQAKPDGKFASHTALFDSSSKTQHGSLGSSGSCRSLDLMKKIWLARSLLLSPFED